MGYGAWGQNYRRRGGHTHLHAPLQGATMCLHAQPLLARAAHTPVIPFGFNC